MDDFNSQEFNQGYSDFEPIELEVSSKSGDYDKLVLNVDELILSNRAGAVVRRVPRKEAWSMVELRPFIANRAQLKFKKDGRARDLLLLVPTAHLKTIKEWMGPTTSEMVKPALRQVVGQNVFFGGLCLLLLLGESSNFLLVGWGILAFALAGGAYFLPRPEWFLGDILFDLFVLLSLVVVSLFSPGSWWLLGVLFLLILLNFPTKIARYRLWKN